MKFARRRVVCGSLVVSLLVGCATTQPIAPVPRGESVSIVVARSPKATGEISIRNEALGGNASAGGGSGFVVGALYGLTCGPLALFCVPLGAMIGGATGVAAGAAIGLTGALSEDNAAKVRARLLRVQQSHDLVDDLGRNVTERAALQWDLKTAAPANEMSVELQDIRLTSTRDDRIGFVVSALVRVRPAGARQPARTNEKVFEHIGPFVSLAEWLDEGSDVLAGNLSVASRQLALQIVSELTQH